jgi:phthiodiolone/phenolphthiodiolone dimycocerosates ketoreductase
VLIVETSDTSGERIMVEFGQQLFFSHSWDLVKRRLAMMVEQRVWNSVWVPDHLRGLPPFAIDAFLSPWSMLGAFAELAPKLRFGVAVTDGIRLHPATLAQNAASLDHQTGGRFILGIGAGEKMNLAAYGFDSHRAVSRLHECIDVMRRLWTEAGPMDFEGQFFHLRKAVLEPKPLQQPFPVWVAGNGPRTRRLAAEVANGWFPFPALPSEYKAGLADIRTRLKQMGRPSSSLAHGFWGRLFMHDDPAQVSQYLQGLRGQLGLEPELLRQLGYWRDEYTDLYKEQGLDPEHLSLLTYDADDVARLDISKLLPIVADIPEKVLAQTALAGSAEELTKKLEAFIRAGVDHFCLEIINGASQRNAPFTYWDVSRILAERVIPTLKE